MEVAGALLHHLSVLGTGDPAAGDELVAGLRSLHDDVVAIVPSCYLLSFVLRRPGGPVTVSVGDAGPAPPVPPASLTLNRGGGDVLVLHASARGAFLLLAEELRELLDPGDAPVLDQRPGTPPAGDARTLGDVRLVDQAVGALLGREVEPAAAMAELHRRAGVDGVSLAESARRLLAALPGPAEVARAGAGDVGPCPVDAGGRSMAGMSTHLADVELKKTVLQALEGGSGVESTRIGVAVDAGTVTLFGEVQTLHEKLAAAEAAMSVDGVRAIAQAVVVRSPFDVPTDVTIARLAQESLERAADVPVQVQAVVQERFVTLSGEVDREFQRAGAEEAVRHLPGVAGLLDLITSPSLDAAGEVERQVEVALARIAHDDRDPAGHRAGGSVEVTVDGHGMVTLSGWVATPGERGSVTDACWAVPGVIEIRDLLQERR